MISPRKPWKKGRQSEYTALQLVVNVCQDKHGRVWSDHEFLTPEDQQLAQGLAQGGAPQLAHVLLTEAVRREAFMCILIQATKDPEFLSQWVEGSTEDKARIEAEIQNFVSHVLTKTVGKMVPGAVSETLMMISEQMGDSV